MTRTALLVAAALLLPVSAQAQQTAIVTSGPYVPLGYCQITALGSSVALITANCSTGSVPNGATIAEICVEVAGVRYRDDGPAPTSSLGMPAVPVSSTVPVCFPYAIKPMTQVKFIAISGSPVVDVAFYKQ